MGIRILIRVAGVDQDASSYYAARSLNGEISSGSERNRFSFELIDPPASVLPVDVSSPRIRPAELDVRIQSVNGATVKTLARGRIRRAEPETITQEGGTYRTKYLVECSSHERDIDRRTVNEVYFDRPTGWIVADIITRYTQGFKIADSGSTKRVRTSSPPCKTVPVFDTKQRKPTQVFDQLAALEGWEWYLDPEGVVHFAPPSDSTPALTLDDANLDRIAGRSFGVNPDSDGLINRVKFFFRTTYDTGTVAISPTASDDLAVFVTGTGTNWAGVVTPGATFQVLGQSALDTPVGQPDTYQIQEIVSGALIKLRSRYSKDYTGPTTGLKYKITQIPTGLIYSDYDSIAALAAIRSAAGAPDDGVYEGSPLNSGSNFTYAEAWSYAEAFVRARSNPVVNVGFQTTSEEVGVGILPGQRVKFDLTKRFSFQETLPIRSIRFEDLGGLTAAGDPLLGLTFSFETRLYAFGKLIKGLEEGASLQHNVTDVQEVADVLLGVERGKTADVQKAPATLETHGRYVWGPSEKTHSDFTVGTHSGTRVVAGKLELAAQGSGWAKQTNNTGTVLQSTSGLNLNDSYRIELIITNPGGVTTFRLRFLNVTSGLTNDQGPWTTWPASQQLTFTLGGTQSITVLTDPAPPTTVPATYFDDIVNLANQLVATGTWTSPYFDAKSLNSWLKTFSAVLATPPASAVIFRFRGFAFSTTFAGVLGAWYAAASTSQADLSAALQQVPSLILGGTPKRAYPIRYFQVEITLTQTGGQSPSVTSFKWSPDLQTLPWSAGHWMPIPDKVFDTQADWNTGTLTDARVAAGSDGAGSVLLDFQSPTSALYKPSGTWRSPWLLGICPHVFQSATATTVTPASTAVSVFYRASLDGTDSGASDWSNDITVIQDWPFYQVEARLSTSDANVTPELKVLQVSPR